MKYLTVLLMMALTAAASLDVGTFNIRNFDKPGSYTDKNLLKKHILESSPDLMAVQEIYNDSSFRSFVGGELRGYSAILSGCGGGGRQKLGFIYKKSEVKLLDSWEDKRLASALDVDCGSLRPAMTGIFKDLESGKIFAAVSVHLKAGGGSRNHSRRAKQYRLISDIIRELDRRAHGNVLVMGDFNTTGFDARNGDYHNFQNLLRTSRAHTSAEDVKCTSYWGGSDYNDGIEEASTLDHVVFTESFYGGGRSSAKVGSHCRKAACNDVYEDVLGASYQNVSDHCPVTLSFQ